MFATRLMIVAAGSIALAGCGALNKDFASRSAPQGTLVNSGAVAPAPVPDASYASLPPASSGPAPSLSLSQPGASAQASLAPIDNAPGASVSVAAAPPRRHSTEKLYNLEPAEKSSSRRTSKVVARKTETAPRAEPKEEEVLQPVAEKPVKESASASASTEDVDAVLPVRKGSRSVR
jgi:hypothetical protein